MHFDHNREFVDSIEGFTLQDREAYFALQDLQREGYIVEDSTVELARGQRWVVQVPLHAGGWYSGAFASGSCVERWESFSQYDLLIVKRIDGDNVLVEWHNQGLQPYRPLIRLLSEMLPKIATLE